MRQASVTTSAASNGPTRPVAYLVSSTAYDRYTCSLSITPVAVIMLVRRSRARDWVTPVAENPDRPWTEASAYWDRMTGRGPTGPLNTYRIETERLVLEVPDEADAPTLFALVGGPIASESLPVSSGTAPTRYPRPCDSSPGTDRTVRRERFPLGDSRSQWGGHRIRRIVLGMISARPSVEPGQGRCRLLAR